MEVNLKIKVYGGIRSFVDGKKVIEKDIDKPITVEKLAKEIGIEEGAIYLAIKQGTSLDKKTKVKNDDTISFMPVIAGG